MHRGLFGRVSSAFFVNHIVSAWAVYGGPVSRIKPASALRLGNKPLNRKKALLMRPSRCPGPDAQRVQVRGWLAGWLHLLNACAWELLATPKARNKTENACVHCKVPGVQVLVPHGPPGLREGPDPESPDHGLRL